MRCSFQPALSPVPDGHRADVCWCRGCPCEQPVLHRTQEVAVHHFHRRSGCHRQEQVRASKSELLDVCVWVTGPGSWAGHALQWTPAAGVVMPGMRGCVEWLPAGPPWGTIPAAWSAKVRCWPCLCKWTAYTAIWSRLVHGELQSAVGCNGSVYGEVDCAVRIWVHAVVHEGAFGVRGLPAWTSCETVRCITETHTWLKLRDSGHVEFMRLHAL